MRYVIGPRGSGRTTYLVQWCVAQRFNQQPAYIVCMNQMEADRINKVLRPLGYAPAITSRGFDRAFEHKGVARLAIDNYDLIDNADELYSDINALRSIFTVDLISMEGPVQNFET